MKKLIVIGALMMCVTALCGQDESNFVGDYIINEKCTGYERGDTIYAEHIKKIRIFKDTSDNYIFGASNVSSNVVINKFRADSFYIDKQYFLQTDYYYDSAFFSIDGCGIVKQDSIHYYYTEDYYTVGGFCVGAGTRIKAYPDTAYQLHHFLPDSAQFIDNSNNLMYNIAGDTIINGKKMKKVYRNTESYYAAIYEDTLNAKYYAVSKGDTAEKLIMDFSVNEGDGLRVFNMNEQLMKFVMAYDVSFDEKGRKIVRTSCYGRGECDVWVEGVGSVWSGVFPDIDCDRTILTPKCPLAKVVVKNGVIYGKNEPISEAVVSIGGTKTDGNISIYPNPTKDYLLVDSGDFECHTYKIISASGAIEQGGELLPSIDITRLSNGIKLIVVKDGNGITVYLDRFIKTE